LASPANLLKSTVFPSLLFFFLSNAVLASNFEIAPVVLELSDSRPAGAIRFVNKDDHEVSLQVRGNEWIQANGDDVLTPTNAGLLVSPPIFTLAPGAAQTIRVVSRLKGVSAETAFRLFIDEIPAATKEPAINFKFRISMPIFVEPEAKSNVAMTWRAAISSQALQLTLTNSGNRRVKLLNFTAILPSGKKLAPLVQPNSYTLVGSSRTIRFTPDAELKPGTTVRISAMSDLGPYESSVIVSP
jgi:fimbrial chaperone protein